MSQLRYVDQLTRLSRTGGYIGFVNPRTAVLTYSKAIFLPRHCITKEIENGATYYRAIEAFAFEENELCLRHEPYFINDQQKLSRHHLTLAELAKDDLPRWNSLGCHN